LAVAGIEAFAHPQTRDAAFRRTGIFAPSGLCHRFFQFLIRAPGQAVLGFSEFQALFLNLIILSWLSFNRS
jgi:hypothetical protein